MNTTSVPMTRYALAGAVAVVLLNLLLRTWVKVGGVFATLLIATLVAAAMALCFAWRNRRAPLKGERRRLVFLYGGLLGLLYLGLLGMMALQDQPSPMGTALFALHYLCYPVLAQVFFSDGFFKRIG